MINATIRYYDASSPVAVVIGTGEDVKAPRALKELEKQGWVVDEALTMTYKAFLAGKRQRDIPADTQFTDWVDTVLEVDLRPTRKQVEQAVALGEMDRDKADRLLELMAAEEEQGEAGAPPV